jgi:large subunit ribosomal protein L21
MKSAVITTGGKQYIAEPGKKVRIEKLTSKEGSEVIFDRVLVVEEDGKVEVGKPYIQGAAVKGKVLRQEKRPSPALY